MAAQIVRTGTAGWSIPAANREAFPGAGSILERYARKMNWVEINSSFYRPHRRETYERWAASPSAAPSMSATLTIAIGATSR